MHNIRRNHMWFRCKRFFKMYSKFYVRLNTLFWLSCSEMCNPSVCVLELANVSQFRRLMLELMSEKCRLLWPRFIYEVFCLISVPFHSTKCSRALDDARFQFRGLWHILTFVARPCQVIVETEIKKPCSQKLPFFVEFEDPHNTFMCSVCINVLPGFWW